MQIIEILVAILLLGFALWLFIRTLKAKSEGKCDSCAAKCPNRDLPQGCGDLLFLDKKQP